MPHTHTNPISFSSYYALLTNVGVAEEPDGCEMRVTKNNTRFFL